MGRIEVCRSNTLQDRVQELISEAGGQGPAVLALMQHVAKAPPPEPATDEGSRTVLVLRLTAEEADAIEAAHQARGMSRAEWAKAVLRRQISDQRQLGRVDRGYMKRALSELQALRQQVVRTRCAVVQAAAHGEDLERPLEGLGAFERKLMKVAEAIRQGFLGEDRYWRRL